jgi:hypothetical protein
MYQIMLTQGMLTIIAKSDVCKYIIIRVRAILLASCGYKLIYILVFYRTLCIQKVECGSATLKRREAKKERLSTWTIVACLTCNSQQLLLLSFVHVTSYTLH